MKQRLIALLAAAVLAVCLCTTALAAHPVPELGRTGSITVTILDEGEPVPDGRLTAYRVGDVADDDGDFYFAPRPELEGVVEDMNAVHTPGMAQALADYIAEQELYGVLKPTTSVIDRKGQACFGGLEQGLYLMVQHTEAPGYLPVLPFLVTVPQLIDNVYVYDVDATPKTSSPGHTPEPEPTPVPTPGPTPGVTLPQTGQLNWPVPVLTLLGVGLFAAGWLLRFGRGRSHD